MKSFQKHEVWFGVAAVIATLGVVIFEKIVVFNRSGTDSNEFLTMESIRTLSFCLMLTLSLSIATYFHVSKQNKLAFIVVSISGTILALFFGLIFFSGGAFYYYGAGGFLFALPMIFGALSVFFAIRQQTLNSRLQMK